MLWSLLTLAGQECKKWKLWFGLKGLCGPTRSYLAHQTTSSVSRCEWSNLVLLKSKGLESIRLDVAKVVEMHFNGVRSPDDELETTKHTTSLLPTNESRPGTQILLYSVFAISLRIATSSKQRFWKLTLKNILAWLGMVRHLTCFECLWFNLLISTSSPWSEVWTGLRQTEGEQNELQIYFGLRTTGHVLHIALCKQSAVQRAAVCWLGRELAFEHISTCASVEEWQQFA